MLRLDLSAPELRIAIPQQFFTADSRIADSRIATQGFLQWSEKRGVHKISARNSGAGNGCANFMGAWHFLVLSAGKPPCP